MQSALRSWPCGGTWRVVPGTEAHFMPPNNRAPKEAAALQRGRVVLLLRDGEALVAADSKTD